MKSKIAILVLFISAAGTTDLTAQNWLWAKMPLYSPDSAALSAGLGGGDVLNVATDKDGNVYEIAEIFEGDLLYDNDTVNNRVTASFGANSYLVKYNSAGSIQWVKQSITKGKCTEFFVATDNAGNVYVTGFLSDTVSFGNTQVYGGAGVTFLLKYDTNGNLLWERQSSTTGCYGFGVATDGQQNVYVTGTFENSVTFGTSSLSDTGLDMFLVKYDSAGNMIWLRGGSALNNISNSSGNAVTTDSKNNVLVTGTFTDTLMLGNKQLVTNPGDYEIFVVKYDSAGNVTWCKQSTGSIYGAIASNAIATDKSGGVYITGGYAIVTNFDNFKLLDRTYNSGYNQNLLIVRFDENGNVTWAKTTTPLASSWQYMGWGLAIDTFNHVYFDAASYECALNLQFGSDTFVTPNPASNENSIILELDTAGNVLCGSVALMGGDDEEGIAVDPSGKYVYTGSDYFVQFTSVSVGATTFHFNPGNIGASEIPYLFRWEPCTVEPLSVTISKVNPSCGDTCSGKTSVSVSGGNAPFSYQWSPNTGDTTAYLSRLCANNYFVTITDFTGTRVTDSVSITQTSTISCSIVSSKNIFCTGDSALICATTHFSSYLWNTGDIGQCIEAKTAGNYYVTVADTSGCTAQSNHVSIGIYPIVSISVIVIGDTISVAGSGNYQWYDNNQLIPGATSSTYIAGNAGSYSVAITDSNGCKEFSSAIDITGITSFSDEQEVTIFPNPNSSNNWRLSVGQQLIGSRIEIYNTEGQLIWKSEIRSLKSELTFSVQPGVYLLRIVSDKYVVAKKLVKTTGQ